MIIPFYQSILLLSAGFISLESFASDTTPEHDKAAPKLKSRSAMMAPLLESSSTHLSPPTLVRTSATITNGSESFGPIQKNAATPQAKDASFDPNQLGQAKLEEANIKATPQERAQLFAEAGLHFTDKEKKRRAYELACDNQRKAIQNISALLEKREALKKLQEYLMKVSDLADKTVKKKLGEEAKRVDKEIEKVTKDSARKASDLFNEAQRALKKAEKAKIEAEKINFTKQAAEKFSEAAKHFDAETHRNDKKKALIKAADMYLGVAHQMIDCITKAQPEQADYIEKLLFFKQAALNCIEATKYETDKNKKSEMHTRVGNESYGLGTIIYKQAYKLFKQEKFDASFAKCLEAAEQYKIALNYLTDRMLKAAILQSLNDIYNLAGHAKTKQASKIWEKKSDDEAYMTFLEAIEYFKIASEYPTEPSAKAESDKVMSMCYASLTSIRGGQAHTLFEKMNYNEAYKYYLEAINYLNEVISYDSDPSEKADASQKAELYKFEAGYAKFSQAFTLFNQQHYDEAFTAFLESAGYFEGALNFFNKANEKDDFEEACALAAKAYKQAAFIKYKNSSQQLSRQEKIKVALKCIELNSKAIGYFNRLPENEHDKKTSQNDIAMISYQLRQWDSENAAQHEQRFLHALKDIQEIPVRDDQTLMLAEAILAGLHPQTKEHGLTLMQELAAWAHTQTNPQTFGIFCGEFSLIDLQKGPALFEDPRIQNFFTASADAYDLAPMQAIPAVRVEPQEISQHEGLSQPSEVSKQIHQADPPLRKKKQSRHTERRLTIDLGRAYPPAKEHEFASGVRPYSHLSEMASPPTQALHPAVDAEMMEKIKEKKQKDKEKKKQSFLKRLSLSILPRATDDSSSSASPSMASDPNVTSKSLKREDSKTLLGQDSKASLMRRQSSLQNLESLAQESPGESVAQDTSKRLKRFSRQLSMSDMRKATDVTLKEHDFINIFKELHHKGLIDYTHKGNTIKANKVGDHKTAITIHAHTTRNKEWTQNPDIIQDFIRFVDAVKPDEIPQDSVFKKNPGHNAPKSD